MADLTIQNLSAEGGGNVTFVSADAAGDKFVYTDIDVTVIIRNGHSAAQSVTIAVPPANASLKTPFFGTLPKGAIVKSIPAGGTLFIPPLPKAFANPQDSGKVSMSYSGVTNLTVAAIQAVAP